MNVYKCLNYITSFISVYKLMSNTFIAVHVCSFALDLVPNLVPLFCQRRHLSSFKVSTWAK